MKSLILLTALSMPLFAASGALKTKATELSKAHQDSTLFISAVVTIELTAGSNPTQKEEKKVEVLGAVLNAEGLIVAHSAPLI